MPLIVAWLVKKGVIAGVIAFLSGLYFIAVFTFFVYIIGILIDVYHLIQSFLNDITNINQSSDIVALSLSLANVSGFLPAFNNSMPLILSAIVFLLMRILYKYTLNTYKDILHQMTEASMVL